MDITPIRDIPEGFVLRNPLEEQSDYSVRIVNAPEPIAEEERELRFVGSTREPRDVFHLLVDFSLGHPQYRPVEIHVLATSHFPMKAGAHFEHGRNLAPDENLARCGRRHARQKFEQRALACAVAADDSQRFSFVD